MVHLLIGEVLVALKSIKEAEGITYTNDDIRNFLERESEKSNQSENEVESLFDVVTKISDRIEKTVDQIRASQLDDIKPEFSQVSRRRFLFGK